MRFDSKNCVNIIWKNINSFIYISYRFEYLILVEIKNLTL